MGWTRCECALVEAVNGGVDAVPAVGRAVAAPQGAGIHPVHGQGLEAATGVIPGLLNLFGELAERHRA